MEITSRLDGKGGNHNESQHFWTAGFFTTSHACSAWWLFCTAIFSHLYLKDLDTVWSVNLDDRICSIDHLHPSTSINVHQPPSTSIKSAMISTLKSAAHSVITANNFAAGFPEAGLKPTASVWCRKILIATVWIRRSVWVCILSIDVWVRLLGSREKSRMMPVAPKPLYLFEDQISKHCLRIQDMSHC